MICPGIIGVSKLRRICCVGRVARMGEMRDAYRDLVWKSDRSLGGTIIMKLLLRNGFRGYRTGFM